jgi:hypothetical protein
MNQTRKERGAPLTVMLTISGLSIILNVVGLLHPLTLRDAYLHTHRSLYLLWALETLVGALGILGVLLWQKWGAYIVILLPVFVLISNITYLRAVEPISASVTDIMFIALLVWIVSKKWMDFQKV